MAGFSLADQVMAVAQREDAIPFDVPDVELGHHGAECTFDAILAKYNLTDPALSRRGEGRTKTVPRKRSMT